MKSHSHIVGWDDPHSIAEQRYFNILDYTGTATHNFADPASATDNLSNGQTLPPLNSTDPQSILPIFHHSTLNLREPAVPVIIAPEPDLQQRQRRNRFGDVQSMNGNNSNQDA